VNRLIALFVAAAVGGAVASYGIRATAAPAVSQVSIDLGEVVQVAGGDIGCKVVRRDGIKTLDCRRAGPLPGTFGVMINKQRVLAVRFETPATAKIILSARHRQTTVTRCS
jgi:hypothetical protein